jgi:hypothetical protein
LDFLAAAFHVFARALHGVTPGRESRQQQQTHNGTKHDLSFSVSEGYCSQPVAMRVPAMCIRGMSFAEQHLSIAPGRIAMTLTTILVILLVLLLIGALPVYPYSRGWGYYPSGILAVVVAVVALMLLL